MNLQLVDSTNKWLGTEQPNDTRSRQTPPHLEPVPAARQRNQRSPLFLALTCVGMFLAILAVQLWLSISISQGAYEANALILENRELARSERVLQQDVDKLSSPQHLAERAIDLGMVQNAHPAYLKLDSSTVVGSLTSTTTDPRENLIPNAALASLTEEHDSPASDEQESTTATSTKTAEAGAATTAVNQEPLPWNGNLPAPETH